MSVLTQPSLVIFIIIFVEYLPAMNKTFALLLTKNTRDIYTLHT